VLLFTLIGMQRSRGVRVSTNTTTTVPLSNSAKAPLTLLFSKILTNYLQKSNAGSENKFTAMSSYCKTINVIISLDATFFGRKINKLALIIIVHRYHLDKIYWNMQERKFKAYILKISSRWLSLLLSFATNLFKIPDKL